MNDMTEALRQFMAANPDQPQGEEAAPEPAAAHRPADRLAVSIERKGRGGKTATIVSGFTCPDDEVAEVARRLKTALGTGGSARGGEILIQGERRREVIDRLRAMGYKING